MGFPDEMIAQALKSEETKLSQMTAKMTSSTGAGAGAGAAAAGTGDGATTTTTSDQSQAQAHSSRQKTRPTPKTVTSSPTSTTRSTTGSNTDISIQTLRSSIEDKRTRMKKMGFPDDVITNALKVDEEKLAKLMSQ